MPQASIFSIRAEEEDFARQFSASLLVPDAPAPALISAPYGKKSDKRYNVYRNNVTVSLIEALVAIFPAVQRITGPDFFRAMARFHVRENPPRSPLLFEYGRDFPEFIDRYEYAANIPWLSDVARIECAWMDSYHAADGPELSAEALASVPPQHLGALTFRPHPATRVLSSAHPAVTIFAMNRGSGPVGPVEDRPEDGLITRAVDEVTVRFLPPGGAAFVNALIDGKRLATAAAKGFEANAAFDLSGLVGEMIAAGAFSHIELETSNVEYA